MPAKGQLKTHCIRGHELSGDNVYVHSKTGIRGCRICRDSWRPKITLTLDFFECSKCHKLLPVSSFYKEARSSRGFRAECKECNKARQSSPEKLQKGREYRAEKREKDPNFRRSRSTYSKNYIADRCLRDVNFRLRVLLRGRICSALKGDTKTGSAVRDLGCSIEELKVHLESKFQPGMTWENWGKGEGKWNVDHIVPLAAFDLTNRNQFLVACNYINLQPLWALDNLRKGDSLLPASIDEK